MPTVFSANRSSVLVDGEAIEGLQSLAYRVVTAYTFSATRIREE